MATDRSLHKAQQAFMLDESKAVAPADEISRVHTRSRDFLKTGAENAATPVAESPMFPVNRLSLVKAIKFTTPTTATGDAANIATITVFKRDSAGANQVSLGSWSTLTSAQGTLTANVPASLVLSTTAGALTVAAGSVLTYSITKGGTGVQIAALSTITVDLEEI